MRLSEILDRLEERMPADLAMDYDNVGLLCGRREMEVRRVCVAVDATDPVVDYAIGEGADLLLTHHPIIFKGLKRVSYDDFVGRRIMRLVENGVGCVAMHTNFDVACMADAAADILSLSEREVLEVTWEENGERRGIGKTGRLPRIMTLRECAELVKAAFDIDSVRVYGDLERRVEGVAVCPGAGRSVIDIAIRSLNDVLITGDIDHHSGIDAWARGLAIIDAGHYGLEKIFVPYMVDHLKTSLRGLEVIGAKETPPFYTL